MRPVALHVGCGGDPFPDWLGGDFDEVRLDIDPRHAPHIVADMSDLGDIGPFDAVVCLHSLEHLMPHMAARALSEFRRVLKPGGFAMVIVPDLEDVRPTDEVVYEGPAGPVTGLDMFYGLRRLLADMPHMAHRCGFVADTLRRELLAAGFGRAEVRRANDYNLIGVGVA